MTHPEHPIDDEARRTARRAISRAGGPRRAAATLAMDLRTMQRIYSGKRVASPTLLRQLAEIACHD